LGCTLIVFYLNGNIFCKSGKGGDVTSPDKIPSVAYRENIVENFLDLKQI
jgi:hypothetical protein